MRLYWPEELYWGSRSERKVHSITAHGVSIWDRLGTCRPRVRRRRECWFSVKAGGAGGWSIAGVDLSTPVYTKSVRDLTEHDW